MLLRLISVLLLFLLAACATTGTGTAEPAPITPEPVIEAEPIRSSTATIDEHLFVPDPDSEAVPGDALHVYESVWERLVHQFSLPECSSNEQSVKWAQWYSKRPEYMARIFKRAQPWVYYIANEIEERGLPGELALLPIVESAYDPFAYSSSQAFQRSVRSSRIGSQNPSSETSCTSALAPGISVASSGGRNFSTPGSSPG